MERKLSTTLRAWIFHTEIAAWILALVMTTAGKLRWAGAGAVIALGAHMAGRLWSRYDLVAMPYFMRWVLFVPRGPHSVTSLQRILQPRTGDRILEIGPGVGVHALPIGLP